ncbi:zinc-binding dehydrogenase, partial [Leptospira santarosai]|nr:zinc-binding dehydrogenase [Leptospira santarosai]
GSESQLYQTLFLGPFISLTGSKKISSLLQRANQKDLNDVKELLEIGKVKPIIDKRFKLSEITEAFNYFQEGHAQGKVVITLLHP